MALKHHLWADNRLITLVSKQERPSPASGSQCPWRTRGSTAGKGSGGTSWEEGVTILKMEHMDCFITWWDHGHCCKPCTCEIQLQTCEAWNTKYCRDPSWRQKLSSAHSETKAQCESGSRFNFCENIGFDLRRRIPEFFLPGASALPPRGPWYPRRWSTPPRDSCESSSSSTTMSMIS